MGRQLTSQSKDSPPAAHYSNLLLGPSHTQKRKEKIPLPQSVRCPHADAPNTATAAPNAAVACNIPHAKGPPHTPSAARAGGQGHHTCGARLCARSGRAYLAGRCSQHMPPCLHCWSCVCGCLGQIQPRLPRPRGEGPTAAFPATARTFDGLLWRRRGRGARGVQGVGVGGLTRPLVSPSCGRGWGCLVIFPVVTHW